MDLTSCPAKYKIGNQIFVGCTMDVIEANGMQLLTKLGIRGDGDIIVPIGTDLILNTDLINRIRQRSHGTLARYWVKVMDVDYPEGWATHICTTIQEENYTNRRQSPRTPCNFSVKLFKGSQTFRVLNGSLDGLLLQQTTGHAVLQTTVGQKCTIDVPFRGKTYPFLGKVRHIQYDWKQYKHLVGIQLNTLTDEQDVILNLLLDPNYEVKLPDMMAIDPEKNQLFAVVNPEDII